MSAFEGTPPPPQWGRPKWKPPCQSLSSELRFLYFAFKSCVRCTYSYPSVDWFGWYWVDILTAPMCQPKFQPNWLTDSWEKVCLTRLLKVKYGNLNFMHEVWKLLCLMDIEKFAYSESDTLRIVLPRNANCGTFLRSPGVTITESLSSITTVLIGYYDFLGTRPKNSHRPIIVTGR